MNPPVALNILRTYPGWESVKNVFILLMFFFCVRSINKGKRNVKLYSNRQLKYLGTFCNIYNDDDDDDDDDKLYLSVYSLLAGLIRPTNRGH